MQLQPIHQIHKKKLIPIGTANNLIKFKPSSLSEKERAEFFEFLKKDGSNTVVQNVDGGIRDRHSGEKPKRFLPPPNVEWTIYNGLGRDRERLRVDYIEWNFEASTRRLLVHWSPMRRQQSDSEDDSGDDDSGDDVSEDSDSESGRPENGEGAVQDDQGGDAFSVSEIHESAHRESQEEQNNGTVLTNGIEEHGSENDGLNQMEQLTMTAAPQSCEDEEAAIIGRSSVREESSGTFVDEFNTNAVSRTAVSLDDHVHGEDRMESAKTSTSTAGNQQPAPEKSVEHGLPVNIFSLLHEEGINAWLTDDIIQTFLVLVTKNTQYAVVDSSLLGDCSDNRINDEKTRFRLRDNILAMQKEHKGKTLVLAFSDTRHWRLVLIDERIRCYDPKQVEIEFGNIDMIKFLAEDLGISKLDTLPHTRPVQEPKDNHNCGVFVLLKVQEVCQSIAWSYKDVRQFRKKFREQINKNKEYYWINMDFGGKVFPIPPALNLRNAEYAVHKVATDQEESHSNAETPCHTDCAGQENLSKQGTVEKRRRTEDDSKEGPPQKKFKNGVMQVSIKHMEQKEDEEMVQREARKDFIFQKTEGKILRCLKELKVRELISTCIFFMDDNNWLEFDLEIRKMVPFLLKTSLKHVERELQTLIGKREQQEEEIEALSDVAKALDAKVKKVDNVLENQTTVPAARNHIFHGAVHDIDKSTRLDEAVCLEKEVDDGTMRFVNYDREQLINRILSLEKDKRVVSQKLAAYENIEKRKQNYRRS